MQVNLASDLRLKLTINGRPIDVPARVVQTLNASVELDGLAGMAVNLGGIIKRPHVTISELAIDLDEAAVRDVANLVAGLVVGALSSPA